MKICFNFNSTLVLLLGDQDSGKLDIYSQFEGKNVRADYASTVGVDFTFRNLLIDDKTIEAQIWYISKYIKQ